MSREIDKFIESLQRNSVYGKHLETERKEEARQIRERQEGTKKGKASRQPPENPGRTLRERLRERKARDRVLRSGDIEER